MLKISDFSLFLQDSKKFKRLKKARRDADAGHSGLFDDDEFLGSGKGARTAQEQAKHTLFGDDDGEKSFPFSGFTYILIS